MIHTSPPIRLVSPVVLGAFTGGPYTNATTSLADLPSTTMNLPFPGVWLAMYAITYTVNAVTTGAHFTLNGTAVQSYMAGDTLYTAGTGDADNSLVFAYDSGLAVASSRVATPSNNGANLSVHIFVTTPGTIYLRYRSEVAVANAVVVNNVTGRAIYLGPAA